MDSKGREKKAPLKMSKTRVQDIEQLLQKPGATQMTHLDISSCNISSLSPFIVSLSAMRRLKHLDVSRNGIVTLKALRNMPTLESINCSHNAMSLLTGFEECPNLALIEAADNQISSIGDLKHLRRLKTLDLVGNQLASIASLPHNLPGASQPRRV